MIFGNKVEMVTFEGALVVSAVVNVIVEEMVARVKDGTSVVPVIDAVIFDDMIETVTGDLIVMVTLDDAVVVLAIDGVMFADMVVTVEIALVDFFPTVVSLVEVTVETVMEDAVVVVSWSSFTLKLKSSKESNELNKVASAVSTTFNILLIMSSFVVLS